MVRTCERLAAENFTPTKYRSSFTAHHWAHTWLEGAEPLGTATFAESWEVLRRRLDGVDKDTPVLTYCTGGIRCVKTNAYIKQQLGFTRTYRLEDGIIGYNRHLRDNPGEGSVWRGENFVFDRRRAEQGSDQ